MVVSQASVLNRHADILRFVCLLSKLLAIYGSVEIVRHLEATARATTAAFGILLIDTAFNVSTLEDLPSKPFVGKVRRGRMRIATVSARKARASGKRNEATLLDGPMDDGEADLTLRDPEGLLSGIKVIEQYREMTEPLRMRARLQGQPHVAEKLWIVAQGRSANGGPVVNDLITMASEWWPNFLERHAEHPVIGGLPISRKMIRPTVLQIQAARNGFNHALAQAIANHEQDRTTMGYIGAPWFRARLMDQVRQFQNLFEAALARGVQDAAVHLGIDQANFEDRIKQASTSGLDFSCAGEERMTAALDPGPTCNPLSPCDLCPARRLVPCDETYRTLHLAHEALVRAEQAMLAQNARRWIMIWLPWRALTEAYVRKLLRSPYKVRFEHVRAATDAELEAGRIALPLIV
jgi:hypothetical protein